MAVHMRRAARLLALLAAVWGAGPASAETGGNASEAMCDPGVRSALVSSAAQGVSRDLVVIRHPAQGIRDPDSILDFSCLADLFDYRSFDILFDPGRALGEILDLARRRVCEAAREAYREHIGRMPDASVYASRVPRLPGLDVGVRRGNILRDAGVGPERLRGIVGGGP